MPEHSECVGCKWNHYPLCYGTIMDDGNYMNIENLRTTFNCGVKTASVVETHVPEKTELELKLEDLESRIETLESNLSLSEVRKNVD